MKRILCAVLAFLTLFCGCGKSADVQTQDGVFRIAASFYPVYITTLNIVRGVDGVVVENLVGNQVGCLHDYTLTTGEMRTIESCDALVVNGAGMEPFMDKILRNCPGINVIDASEGIKTVQTDGEENPHVWLDVQNAIAQLDTITDGLCALRPENEKDFRMNAQVYREKLEKLDAQLRVDLEGISGAKLITFHEAFEYFAHAYGVEIAAAIYQDEHTTPSPTQVENVIETMKVNEIKAIFTEPQHHDSLAQTIADAIGAEIFTLDPCVSGDGQPDSYISAMLNNKEVLLSVFGK